jgi:opacity protein-like surface antigen
MRDGWNIGAGAEYAWINNWMVGVEYRQLTRR